MPVPFKAGQGERGARQGRQLRRGERAAKVIGRVCCLTTVRSRVPPLLLAVLDSELGRTFLVWCRSMPSVWRRRRASGGRGGCLRVLLGGRGWFFLLYSFLLVYV